MATVSTPSLAYPSPTPPPLSPPAKGLKKVLSSRRRSSEAHNETGAPSRASIDSLNLDRATTATSARSSPTRDGTNRSSRSSVHKLIPGHTKRERRKVLEAELRAVEQDTEIRGRNPASVSGLPPGAFEKNGSTSSLLTDGSENDTPPPLVPRKSHTGYFTTSSPLISSKTFSDGKDHTELEDDLPSAPSTEAFPVILEPDHSEDKRSVSPKSLQLNLQAAPAFSSPGLIDKADTLRIEGTTSRRSSISKLRGKSPARKFRDVFSRAGKSPRTSPERASNTSLNFSDSGLSDQASIAERRNARNPDSIVPTPLMDTSTATQAGILSPKRSLVLETDVSRPLTPPSGRLITPLTTVTPPTPTDTTRDEIVASPKLVSDFDTGDGDASQRIASPSVNSPTHRRARSTSSATHQKSKLSTSMTAPLTPTIEEARTPVEKSSGGRNFTAGSGFFSSWVSAAQTAATSITNLTVQNRSRAGTGTSDQSKPKTTEEGQQDQQGPNGSDQSEEKKELAIETLGSGSLNFGHLGLDMSADDNVSPAGRPDISSMRQKPDLRRDEAEAKVEDIMAKRAVSAAYEVAGDGTPVAEVSDPIANIRHSQTFDVNASGTLTPPNGSILEGEGGTIRRSNSVRSKIVNRRSRGSSIATGQSAIGAMIGASTAALTNPATGPRSTGFTPASKQRNRGFHQQFRSVPEDDNLIEDYSCALQKEILLAGRIYISEGHICFSSNILGWVTTLIISFEEIVSIERENTAMIIPNAIAIQTLHARHTFRSLLSREATFDLMIGIWRVTSPASFSKSVNGRQMIAEQAQNDVENALAARDGDGEESEGSSVDGSGSNEDEDDGDSAPSVAGSSPSIAGSEFLDATSVTRKPSGTNGGPALATGNTIAGASGDVSAAAAAIAGVPGAVVDYPGPTTHTPTDCTDSATHYDKVIKDEIIPAPLGKIYSLLYGPQSGVFLRKYLVDECKSLDLALEDDKKGLTNENKSRQYSYIKPLGGSIGPKQTKCITTENLDFFDLEKSVSVTCTTQTPDVPSGSAFSTKTRYCLSWAPGNATRLQMSCTIEWTAKSWLKGPIEKGANDGQQQYGDGLVKSLKAALGRSRGATVGSKGAKTKRKRKGDKKTKSEQTGPSAQQSSDWGIFEPVRSTLEPVTNLLRPIMKIQVIVGVLSIMTIILWFGGNRGGNRAGYVGSGLDRVERWAAYEHLWQKEESELWDWLEDRAGVRRVTLGDDATKTAQNGRNGKEKIKSRQKLLKDNSMATRLQAEKWSQKEMQEAVRVTRERLDEMQRVLDSKVV